MKLLKVSIIVFLVILVTILNCTNDTGISFEEKPLAPTDLQAVALSKSEILLTWIDWSDDEDGFEVYESISNIENFGLLTRTEPNVDSIIIQDKLPGTTYYYYVLSFRGNAWSVQSSIASATTYVDTLIPSAPSNLQAQATSSTQINLNWQDNSNNEDGFKIERKTGATGTFTEIWSVTADVTSYQNTGLTPDTDYYYRVRAYNSGGNSSYSNEAGATTIIQIPSAPSNLQAQAISSTQINLSWQDNSNNEDGFRIERKTGATGVYAEIWTVAAGTTSYQNTGLTPDTEYYFRVRAYNSGGNSSYSNEAGARTSAPSLITVIYPNGGEVFYNGDEIGINYNADQSIPYLKIRLLKDGLLWREISTFEYNDGLYEWHILISAEYI